MLFTIVIGPNIPISCWQDGLMGLFLIVLMYTSLPLWARQVWSCPCCSPLLALFCSHQLLLFELMCLHLTHDWHWQGWTLSLPTPVVQYTYMSQYEYYSEPADGWATSSTDGHDTSPWASWWARHQSISQLMGMTSVHGTACVPRDWKLKQLSQISHSRPEKKDVCTRCLTCLSQIGTVLSPRLPFPAACSWLLPASLCVPSENTESVPVALDCRLSMPPAESSTQSHHQHMLHQDFILSYTSVLWAQ